MQQIVTRSSYKTLDELNIHLIRRGYIHKCNMSLDGQFFVELMSPAGSSMVIALGGVRMKQFVAYGKKPAILPGISKAAIVNIMREANGLVRAMIMEGKNLFLTTDPSRVLPDKDQTVTGEEYETVDTLVQSHFRAIPVVTLEEFQLDEDSCLKLCERVSARIHNKMITELVDSRECLHDLHEHFTAITQDYLIKHSDLLYALTKGYREHKTIVKSSTNSQDDICTSSKNILREHEKQLEILHSHTSVIRQMCSTIQTFNQQMSTFHPHITEMHARLPQGS